MEKVLIAHRGNLSGKNPEQENNPYYLDYALLQGFDIELDVWYLNKKFLLGHDFGKYEVSKDYFYNNKMWIHCKNIEALFELKDNPIANCFFHNIDDCVLTSRNYIWTYPGKLPLTSASIAVMPELVPDYDFYLKVIAGVCTDYPSKYKELLK